jgi:hypothetical protein
MYMPTSTRTRRLARSAAWLVLLAGSALAAPPRESVDAVADAVARHYFDPQRGEELAERLRDAAAAGMFDAATQPQALVAALNPKLRAMDGHLRVRVAGTPGEGVGRRPRPAQDPKPLPPGGIRKVEVLEGDIGYLSLGEFAHFEFGVREGPVRKAIDAALDTIADTDAVVIDLRGNGGGSPAMVGYLASAFTPRGARIFNSFHTRDAVLSEAPGEWRKNPRTQVPLYVLIDGDTGSAAESFAYTLSAAKRATVVGERSGGAANPGRYFPTDVGLDVFVPTGSPRNPITGGNWEGSGVEPHVATPSAEALVRALALARARKG